MANSKLSLAGYFNAFMNQLAFYYGEEAVKDLAFTLFRRRLSTEAYFAMLKWHKFTPKELATEPNVDDHSIYRIIHDLKDLGLIEEICKVKPPRPGPLATYWGINLR